VYAYNHFLLLLSFLASKFEKNTANDNVILIVNLQIQILIKIKNIINFVTTPLRVILNNQKQSIWEKVIKRPKEAK